MTTRLVVAYGLIAVMIAFAVIVALWWWRQSRGAAEFRERRRVARGHAERRKAREASEG